MEAKATNHGNREVIPEYKDGECFLVPIDRDGVHLVMEVRRSDFLSLRDVSTDEPIPLRLAVEVDLTPPGFEKKTSDDPIPEYDPAKRRVAELLMAELASRLEESGYDDISVQPTGLIFKVQSHETSWKDTIRILQELAGDRELKAGSAEAQRASQGVIPSITSSPNLRTVDPGLFEAIAKILDEELTELSSEQRARIIGKTAQAVSHWLKVSAPDRSHKRGR